MAELRKDYLLDRYVIIAAERGKRPQQFAKEKKKHNVKIDFFAPGNELMTPPEIGRREDHNGWYIRWFDNKFPVVNSNGEKDLQTHNHFYTFAGAIGKHEVIVESPNIDEDLADLSVDHIKELFEVYRERINELKNHEGVRYVSVFKNHLEAAGTSIVHTHSQIIAYNLLPMTVQKKIDSCKNHHDPCKSIIESESKSRRKVFENDSFISFTPYASRFPMEVWVFPKKFARNLHDFDGKELYDLASMMKKILKRLQSINAPYNYFLTYAPEGENLRFHIEVCPRLTTWAGFEMATETIINPVSPEDAANFYKEENGKG